jgi:hypothetical protein
MAIMTIEDINNRQDLKLALAAHDWWYRESDDIIIYKAGLQAEQSFEWVLGQFQCPFDMLTFHKFFSPGHMTKLTTAEKQAIENWFNE